MNARRRIVKDNLLAFGMKVTSNLVHPHCCIAFDEVGADINMTCDGADTKKYVSRKGTHSKQEVAKKGKQFTTLPIVTLNGKPLICVVIILSDTNIYSRK